MHTPDLGLPGLEDPVPPSWTTIEDDFVLIYVVKQVWPNTTAVCLHPAAMSIISSAILLTLPNTLVSMIGFHTYKSILFWLVERQWGGHTVHINVHIVDEEDA